MSDGCANCQFWKELDPDGESSDADGGYEVTEFGTGLCRRMPPASKRTDLESSLNSMDAARTVFWPVTWGEDWCGEHRSPPTDRDAALKHSPAPSMLSLMPSLRGALKDFLPGHWRVEYAMDALAADDAFGQVNDQAAALRASMIAVPRDWLDQRLATLWASSVAARPVHNGAMTVWLAETARLLDDVPWDIAAFAIDEAAKAAAHGFLPSIGEIRAIADPLFKERKLHLKRAEVIIIALADDGLRAEREARWAAAARDRVSQSSPETD